MHVPNMPNIVIFVSLTKLTAYEKTDYRRVIRDGGLCRPDF